MLLGIVVVVLLVGASFVVAWAPAVVLRTHRATEVRADQAPQAFSILAELAAACGCERPRLFVLPSLQPNGFAVADRRRTAVALTEGTFESLRFGELRGLLAILVALSAHPGTKVATAVAALAIVFGPLVFPARALIRRSMPARRWFEVDRRGAELVGPGAVIAALRELASPSKAFAAAGMAVPAASLFCASPMPTELSRALDTHPSVESRLNRLAKLTSTGPSEMGSQSAGSRPQRR